MFSRFVFIAVTKNLWRNIIMFGKIGKIFGGTPAEKAAQFVSKEKPVYRFCESPSLIGAQVRPADTRTPAQIEATLDALIERNPSLKKFAAELKEMNPEHMALASDVLEIAGRREMLMDSTAIDMNSNLSKGRTILNILLGKFPKLSKENPQALDLAKEVINNTDSITAKYYLSNMAGVNPSILARRNAAVNREIELDSHELYRNQLKKKADFVCSSLKSADVSPAKMMSILNGSNDEFYSLMPKTREKIREILGSDKFIKLDKSQAQERVDLRRAKLQEYCERYGVSVDENSVFASSELAQQMDASKQLVHDIAEQTISGGYLGTFEKQNSFMNLLGTLINREAKPEKIAMVPKLQQTASKIDDGAEDILYLDRFVKSNTPLSMVEENLNTVGQVAEIAHANGKKINIVDFVNNNVNLD